MSIVDDPVLALIMRFVIDREPLDVSDEAFLQRQLETLKTHLAQFPKEQQQPKAMEWIERHAVNYRRGWRRTVISKTALKERCTDCPLLDHAGAGNCAVHGQWLALLKRYLSDELSSAEYVEDALRLLQAHKSELKITRSERHSNASSLVQ